MLREQLGLTTGTMLVVEDDEQGDARLNVHTAPHIVEKNGLLVIAGEPLEDLTDIVQRHREERIQKFIKQAGL